MAMQGTRTSDLPAERPALLQALRIVAPVITLLVLVQAAFIGQGLYRPDADLVRIHGYLGNASWALALVQVALVLFAGLRGRLRPILIGTSVLLLVLMTAQIGLGYSGRDGGQAAAWHIPIGVLIFGLTIAMMTYVAQLRRGEG
jgi:hypothetical protein